MTPTEAVRLLELPPDATPEHLEALKVHGACRHHRKFFSPVAATFTLEDDNGVAVSVTVS